MEEVCSQNKCTGCGLCEALCPHKCITMEKDDLDVVYPHINHNLCVDCGLCQKKCPSNQDIEAHYPKNCYAAWSNDKIIRHNGASGGIASELYKLAIKNGWFTAGVSFNNETRLVFIPVECNSDIDKVRNSKYVQANSNGIFETFKRELKSGRICLFIGLPCQVAAIKSLIGDYTQNLYTCDIICHGVPPVEYLHSHVKSIEKRYNFKSTCCSFREPKKGTESFFFSLWQGNKIRYAKNKQTNDLFQLAYHGALIYRENCYNCRYAKGERVGDLTIGDFDGLGKDKPFDYYRYQLSCVLSNTDKGEKLIELLHDNVTFVERDVEEAVSNQRQLRCPALPHKDRDKFVSLYRENHDFVKAATPIFEEQMRHNLLMRLFVWEPIHIIQLITPQFFRNFIKKIIRYVK